MKPPENLLKMNFIVFYVFWAILEAYQIKQFNTIFPLLFRFPVERVILQGRELKRVKEGGV